MFVNENVAISSNRILLVPYGAHHVPTYHEWMKDEEIQNLTASEPLSLAEEHGMQTSWRSDGDKLTFIICLPLTPDLTSDVSEDGPETSRPDEMSNDTFLSIFQSQHDSPSRMVGDVNLFLTPTDEDEEGCIGELELMIADPSHRRHGYGRAALLAFMLYLTKHLHAILEEYASGVHAQDDSGKKMKLMGLRVKIGSKNEGSIRLFKSLGFIQVGEGENYFGEVELCFEGFLGEERVAGMCEKWGLEEYKELLYKS